MTKYIVLVVALLVGGCESEAPEPAMGVDAGAVGSSDCGTVTVAADAEVAPDATAVTDLPLRAVYDVRFARVSDYEPGSCGFDLDWFANRLEIDGDSCAWTAEINGETADGRAECIVTREPMGFVSSWAYPDPLTSGIAFPFGPCAATLAADGSWKCEMERHWVESDGSIRCFNRYIARGTLLP